MKRDTQTNVLRATGAALALAAASAASAGILPPGFDFICEWGDGNVWKASKNAGLFESLDIPEGNGGALIELLAPHVGSSWTLDSLFVAFTQNPSQTNAFTFTNTSATTQTFTITIVTPGSISGPTLAWGSIAGGLTDNLQNGATFGAPLGGAVYTALIDGTPFQTLWNDPYSVSTLSPPFTESLGSDEFNALPAPGVVAQIAIQHTFTLTSFDSVTINSAFVVIPGPGGLAVLACGFLFGRRRRR